MRECLGVTRRHKHAVRSRTVDDLCDPADRRSDHGDADCHRLRHDERSSLLAHRRDHDGVRGSQVHRDATVFLTTDEENSTSHAEGAGLLLETRTLVTVSNQHEARRRVSVQTAKRVESERDPLLPAEAADRHEHRPSVEPDLRPGCLLLPRLEDSGVDAVRHDVDAQTDQGDASGSCPRAAAETARSLRTP